jgi:coenzyme PQQ precursor peptide PqqA
MVSAGAGTRFMKIMRSDSWSDGCAVRSAGATMRHASRHSGGVLTREKETAMQWETPTAIDFRFGFEITLYVAAR